MDTNRGIQFDRMIELLNKKKQLLGEMLELTKAQSKAIDEGSLDEIQMLIDEKQKRIIEIDKLDADFSVYFESLKISFNIKKLNELNLSAHPQAKQLKQVTSEVVELIGKIGDIEKVNSSKSKKLLEELGLQIKKVNQGKKINNAYNNPTSADTASFFMDQKK